MSEQKPAKSERMTSGDGKEPAPGDFADHADSLHGDVRSTEIPATFSHLIDSIKDYAIFMLDAKGRVATWNAGAKRIKGYEPHEIIGHHFAKFYSPEEKDSGRCEMALEAAAREGRFEDESWRVRKHGTRFWANVVITALRDEAGALVGFAKIVRDLTERRKCEDDRVELAKLQEASRLTDQFLASISHELRTPLNAIVGWSDLLEVSGDPSLLEKGLDTIRRNAAAQGAIIDDMLDISRIVTGKMRLDVRAVDMAEIVRDAIEIVRPAADAKDLGLRVSGAEQSLAMVGDPVRLRQTAWNFLSNAVKFSDKGGHIHVSLSRQASAVVLRVDDTGRGIDPGFLPYVFDPFVQSETGPSRRFGGVGLGLTIVKHIVELHGGQVDAESQGLGSGASFTVRLPIRTIVPLEATNAAAGERGTGPGQAQDRGAVHLDGLRILILDDEPDEREVLQMLFRSKGATTHLDATAKEGREAMDRFKPHIIVTDIGMPGEDGYQFLRTLRVQPKERGRGIPAIALTALRQRRCSSAVTRSWIQLPFIQAGQSHRPSPRREQFDECPRSPMAVTCNFPGNPQS